MESYPYQSHLRVLWQMNAGDPLLSEWLAKLHSLLQNYDPLLIMLGFTNADESFRQIFDLRGQAWTNFIVDFVANTALGKSKNLQGMSGAVQFLNAYNNQLAQWSSQWPFKKAAFEAWSSTPSAQTDEILALVHA